MPIRSFPQSGPVKKPLLLPLVLGLLFVLMTASSALAQTFSGLSGTVQDNSKASVKGAKVTVTSLETGVARVATTSSAGFYSFPDLLVGHYSVRVESPGFQSELNPGVKLDGSVSATINFALKPGNVAETVDVEAVAVELDRTSSSIGGTFNLQQLENLPINDRDYMRFAFLNTGVTLRTSALWDITFDGVGGQGNHFYIDGVDATQIASAYSPYGFSRGERLANGSQEAIAEFHVLSNGYPAEYGRADGGVVNIISKAGTNHYHGEAFDYFRNEALDARNFFARTTTNPIKPRFRYNDFGGNLSGPIWKDKTFLFANYEGDRQQLGLVTSGTVLSSTARAQAIAAFPALAPLVNAEPVGVDISPTSQVANVNVSGNLTVSENDTSVRVDHNFSKKDSMFARYNFNQSQVAGPLYGTSAGLAFFGVNQNQSVPTAVTNIAVHEQHIFSTRLINDALAGFQRYYNDLNQAYPLPRVTIGGITANIGSLGNTYYINDGYQYGDAMTLVLNRHTLKFGTTFYRLQLHLKSINTALIQYASVSAFIANTISQVTLSAGDPGNNTEASEISSYAQDSWQARPNLSINYGVRWDVETTPHDKFYATQAYNPSTGTLFSPGHEYYPVDLATLGPRVGVAYSPTPRMVIRAGSGVYFQNQIAANAQNVYANTLTGNQTLTQAGNPGLSYPYTSFANGSASIPSVYGFASPHPDDFTIHYNVSLSEELRHGLYAQVAYVGVYGSDLDRTEDLNIYAQNAHVRPNPNFSDIYVYENNGELEYNSLQASLKGKIKKLTMNLNYTWAHAIDDDGDGGTYPQDYNNLAAERGNGAQDQRQNFNYNFTYDIPMGMGYGFLGSSVTPVKVLASGWSVNSIGIFETGNPINVTQTVNSYGNSNLVNQRPSVVPGQPKYLPTAIQTNGNVSFLNPAAWTVAPTGTFGNSPRNSVTGPHFTNVDFSLRKSTQIHDNQRLEFRAEFFNIFNHPNFAAPLATFANGSTTFGQISSTFGTTIGFGTSRQIQFALKYSF